MIYPVQKKKVPKAYSGMNLENYRGGAAASSDVGAATKGMDFSSSFGNKPAVKGVSGGGAMQAAGAAIQGVTEISGHIKAAGVDRQWLLAEDSDQKAYGAKPNVGKTVGKSALSGAAAGATIGSVVPGIGTAIGAVVGGAAGAVVGLVGGNKKKKKYYRDMRDRQLAVNQRRNEAANRTFLQPTFAQGGEIDAAGGDDNDFAVVLGGNLHKDGGNAIIDAKTGEKKFETEKSEILFSGTQSATIDSHITKFDSTGDEYCLVELGKSVRSIIKNKTKDNSGTYDLSKAK